VLELQLHESSYINFRLWIGERLCKSHDSRVFALLSGELYKFHDQKPPILD
jgi:hypothetical protein